MSGIDEDLPVWTHAQQTFEVQPDHPGMEPQLSLRDPNEELQQHSGRRRGANRVAFLVPGLVLGVAAGFALALTVLPRLFGTSETAASDTDAALQTAEVAQPDGGTAVDSEPTLGSEPELADILDPSNLPTGAASDRMAIQIETLDPDQRGGATATVRQDGRVHFEGAFRSQSEADRYIARAAEIFGEDVILEAYTIDPAAPPPAANNVSLDKPVLFETGSATIHPEFVPFLEACGNILKLNPSITMSISAYTDTVGDETFNLELSQQRAQAIVDFYLDFEVDSGQLLGSGLGEESDFGTDDSDESLAQNRRAMLQLLDVMDE